MARSDAKIQAYVFDAYGTVFDVHSAVARHRAAIGPGADALSALWRVKQLEYSWVRTLHGDHQDFAALTAQALDYAIAACAPHAAGLRDRLLAAYDNLSAYPDVAPALARLKESGAKLAILSNGAPAMLARAVESAGLGGVFDAVISAETAGRFKTDPSVYALAEPALGVAPPAVSFLSSNRWDIAGAARFGFRAVWINRAGAPDEYRDRPPALVAASLDALP